MNKLRKILFPLFVLIYVTCCPLLILHALGIILTPAAKKSLIRTGVISLETYPAGADVEFNQQIWEEKTPTVIRSLREGSYPVKLSLKGYRSWEQNLLVQPAKATSVEDILLIPDPWLTQTLLPSAVKDSLPLEGDAYLLLKAGDELGQISYYHWPEGLEESLPINVGNFPPHTPVALVAPDVPLAKAEILAIKTSLQSPQCLIQVKTPEGIKFLFFDPKDGAIRMKDLTDLISAKAKDIRWTGQKPTDLYFREGHDLTRIDLEAKGIFPKIAQDILGFGINNKKIYVLYADQLNLLDLDGKSLQSISHPEPLSQEIKHSAKNYTVYPFTEMITALQSETGQLLINRPPYLILDKGVLGLRYLPKTKQILFWTINRIGIMDFSQVLDETGAPVCTLYWPVDHGRQISQVFFVNDGTHLLYRDGQVLKLTSLNPNLNSSTEILFEVAPNTNISYSDKFGEIFFIEPKNHLFSQVTLHSGRAGQNKKADKEKKDANNAL